MESSKEYSAVVLMPRTFSGEQKTEATMIAFVKMHDNFAINQKGNRFLLAMPCKNETKIKQLRKVQFLNKYNESAVKKIAETPNEQIWNFIF